MQGREGRALLWSHWDRGRGAGKENTGASCTGGRVPRAGTASGESPGCNIRGEAVGRCGERMRRYSRGVRVHEFQSGVQVCVWW